ncbi:MAG: asparagine synthase [Thiohalocapsa sp.]|uniref:asparagine synthetase B family protein n=1 Tax=Thiohalocapsa sp. TaxID=2497641 RepID=UPI0025FCED78|nr:asparagine synthase-related protein [Thiohalocapsa sp.]MCG6942258.1 asparagine synthase [Thiohalocapsa sp.]
MNGLLGGKDLGAGDLARLAHFAETRGGAPKYPPGRFALWGFGSPVGGLRAVCGGAVHAWVLGDWFVPQSARSKPFDPAQVLDAYRHAGHGWVWSVVGQFALVLWDDARRELALYRDDSSAQTLYYHRLPSGALLFSDRLDLLVNCPLVPRRLSTHGLHEYLRFLDVSSPNTIYDGVHGTEPGVLCLHGRHGLHQLQPPAAGAGPIQDTPPTLDEAAATLDAHLAAAVAVRTRDTDALVAFLSGGVDSAYLCALAADLGKPLTAVTVGFDDAAADESHVAAGVANALGVPHHVLRFSPAQYRRAFETLAAAEYPFADPAGTPTLLAFERARELADTALDGTGADTLLGIMPARHQRLAVQFAARVPFALRRALARAMAAVPRVRDYRPLLDFGDPEEVLMRWRGWSRREIERLCGRHVSLAETRFYRVFRSFAHADHMARFSALMGNLPDDRIHVAAAATGLRVRFPFFDPPVVDYVWRLPVGLRYADGVHKRVLKHALAQRLPRSLWDVPKHGFDFPFDTLLAADNYALLRAHADTPTLARLGCADTRALRDTVTAYLAGSRQQRFRVWALSVLGAWLQRHGLLA